jgi:hypothetical protein
MPVRITIEDPNKYRKMNKTLPDDQWKSVVRDVSGAVTITDDGSRLLEDGTMRLLENGQTRNLE